MAKRKSFEEKNNYIHPTRKKIIDTVFGRDDNTQKVHGYALSLMRLSPPVPRCSTRARLPVAMSSLPAGRRAKHWIRCAI